jgi:hypothetical protein
MYTKSKFIIQIDDKRLSEFIYYWIYYDKPCDLLFLKPKTEGLTAIKVTVETHEAADFLAHALKKINFKLFKDEK